MDDLFNARDELSPNQPEAVDSSQLLLIVVGSHLRAEIADRPLAYRLHKCIGEWLRRHARSIDCPFKPLVCSDIWYVNQDELQHRPTISVGGPKVNALSAYYAKKVPAAILQENKMIVQLDPEFVDLRACVWGVDHRLTVDALDLFIDRYLDDYLRAVATQVEPKVD